MKRNEINELYQHIQEQIKFLQSVTETPLHQNKDLQTILGIKPSPMLNAINQSRELSRLAALDFGKLIQGAADDVEKSKRIILEYGFPPHYELNIKQFRAIAKCYEENGKEQTDKLLDEFFLKFFNDEKISGFLKKWLTIEWLDVRHIILQEAISAHLQGMHYASISTLLPQIEGVIYERNGFIGRAVMQDLKDFSNLLLNESGDFTLDSAVHTFYTGTVLTGFVFGQEIISPLSRHAILHGADTKFGYKLNSIRCIVLFDYLIDRFANLD
ncbi:hypothetical protein [Paenibacillus elgii]|uniref:hypothetical protein n=1 Tax=Paenibacillus elgii TaxID=189691 RepID=UPI0020420775|nr:hypothetical protein [Paenibacillus elgii]MCM3273994.1 hypothetical protein [Paenibacillus elgii]